MTSGHQANGKTYWTVEEASCWLTADGQPLPLALLRQLGKDCSMICRMRHGAQGDWVDVPVFGRQWATERGYTAAVLREVFANHPETKVLLQLADALAAAQTQEVAAAGLRPDGSPRYSAHDAQGRPMYVAR